ncbi:unnamed protein product [Cunninghamella blakesleeana]
MLLNYSKFGTGLSDLFHRHHEEVEAVQTEEHKSKLSHQAIAGAAAYQAVKAYNEHKEKNGEETDHAKAKQFLAAAAAAAVTRLVETKGLDAIDKHKAEKEAQEQLEKAYDAEH